MCGLLLEVIVLLDIFRNAFVWFLAFANRRQQTGLFDVEEANAIHAASQVENVRVSLQEVLSGGSVRRILSKSDESANYF